MTRLSASQSPRRNASKLDRTNSSLLDAMNASIAPIQRAGHAAGDYSIEAGGALLAPAALSAPGRALQHSVSGPFECSWQAEGAAPELSVGVSTEAHL